ncbi:hypothetical protein [Psychroserpens sp. NJDZ02]|uniref:hypothetical protein n=1 Tax=Psychroserpens sp. NJDZ02 TaxID=2570561 RepID=UPI0010A8D3E2|nr:hypothetical protein [Psychroserpens sp. NJDZ02]QCE42195.1 hypothetical protein E9099_12540 [Psychroserpens sp. NJDZ02]
MKTNTNIQDKIGQTVKVSENIAQVNVSPFFKDKTMQRLFSEKEVVPKTRNWFTPQFQLATLVCVIAINIYAVKQLKNTEYNQSISSFATDYGLDTTSESSLFNL